MQRRNTVEAVQQGRRVQGAFRRLGFGDRIVAEPLTRPPPPPGAPGQGGTSQRAEPESEQLGQMSLRRGARRPVAAAGPCRVAVARAVGVRGEPEAPSLPEPIRIDEVRPVTDVAAEIERGERRPISAVAQEIVGDAPQRVARLHGIGRGGDGPLGRCGANREWRGERGARPAAGRRAGPRAGRQCEGCAQGREGEHAERNARGHAVEDRRAKTYANLPTPHVVDHRPEQLRAAGGPGHPGRQDEEAQRIARQRPPGVPETARQRIADDHHEHGRHGRKGEKGGDGGAGDVEDRPRMPPPGRVTHPPVRWRWCRSAASTPTWAR